MRKRTGPRPCFWNFVRSSGKLDPCDRISCISKFRAWNHRLLSPDGRVVPAWNGGRPMSAPIIWIAIPFLVGIFSLFILQAYSAAFSYYYLIFLLQITGLFCHCFIIINHLLKKAIFYWFRLTLFGDWQPTQPTKKQYERFLISNKGRLKKYPSKSG